MRLETHIKTPDPRMKGAQRESLPRAKRVFGLFFAAVCVIGAFLFVLRPADNENPYLIRHVNMVHRLGFTFSDYVRTHPAADLKHASLEDLLALNVFAPEEASYLRDNPVVFHGYDPAFINGTTPLLDEIYTHWNGRKQRIVCFSDGSVNTLPMTTNQ